MAPNMLRNIPPVNELLESKPLPRIALSRLAMEPMRLLRIHHTSVIGHPVELRCSPGPQPPLLT